MTDETLKKIRASKGWAAEVHGNLALIYVGAGGCADIYNTTPNSGVASAQGGTKKPIEFQMQAGTAGTAKTTADA
jgi:hypothetical protein